MSESYQIVPPPGSSAPLDSQRIADLLAKDGQLILPLLDLLENAQCASTTSSTSWAAPPSRRCSG